MQKKIADATASEVADYAKTFHGLDVRHTMGKDRIVAELAKVGYTADEITVEAPPSSAVPVRPGLKPDDFGSKEMVRILIMEQEGAGGSEPVWAAVNGRGQWIPRGKPVAVRKPYLEVLQHAVKRVPVKGENELIVGWREVPMYQYQILGPAEPAAA